MPKRVKKEFKGTVPEKFRRKYYCKRCHDFFVDSKELLEEHREHMHGEYSLIKHQSNKIGNKKLKKIYLNRNIYKKEEEILLEKSKKKRKLKNCFVYRCQNCHHIGLIFGDITKKLQNLILCIECGCNIFKDHRLEMIEYFKKQNERDTKIKNLLYIGIDMSKFVIDNKIERAMKVAIDGALGKFIERRNGK